MCWPCYRCDMVIAGVVGFERWRFFHRFCRDVVRQAFRWCHGLPLLKRHCCCTMCVAATGQGSEVRDSYAEYNSKYACNEHLFRVYVPCLDIVAFFGTAACWGGLVLTANDRMWCRWGFTSREPTSQCFTLRNTWTRGAEEIDDSSAKMRALFALVRVLFVCLCRYCLLVYLVLLHRSRSTNLVIALYVTCCDSLHGVRT